MGGTKPPRAAEGTPRDAEREVLDELTDEIIGCAISVLRTLGIGFAEKVYENALTFELRSIGRTVHQQKGVNVYYRGQLVGEYVTDLLVDDRVIVELKAAQALDDVYRTQCLNYLKATGLTVCLLLNFGTPRLGIKRFVRNF